MSLDIHLLVTKPCEVYSSNITHNLAKMADAAGIYEIQWRPDEIGVTQAKELVEPLEKAIAHMKDEPSHYKTFDSPNGWGTYENFVPWLDRLLMACREHPEAQIEVSR